MVVAPQSGVVFREVQRWGLWLRGLVLALCLLGAAGGVAATVAGLAHDGRLWAPLVLSVVAGVLVPIGVAVLIWIARLETEIRPDGLYLRYLPFHRRFRRFAVEDLREYYARTYRPLREYGGWGIRYSWHGRAYNVSGHQGVQLVLRDGRRVLVGSARPFELETALRSILREK